MIKFDVMRKSLLIILFYLLTGIAFSQTRSTITETINGKKYYVHTVHIRETFYGLSKLYGVSIDDIQIANNNLSTLSTGQNILIPFVESTTTEPQEKNKYENGEIIEKNDKTYIVHIVQPGQTLYSIARLYQTTTQDIIGANSELHDNQTLSVNQQIFIPFDKSQPQSTKQTQEYKTEDYHYQQETKTENLTHTTVDNDFIRKTINVSLLLPFFLNNQIKESDGIVSQKEMIYEKSISFLEYYEGCMLALDSLKKLGISVNLNVIESNNDSATANTNKIKTNNDLIIGPVFQKTFPAAAAFAKRNAIPIVFPLSYENINTTNPYVIQINPPQLYRFKAMADNIVKNNDNCHVCILYNTEKEKKTVLQCRGAFSEFKDKLNSKHISVEELDYATAGASGLDRALNKKSKTIVVVLSVQQAFANNIVTKLFQSSKSHDIELWGMPQWEKYDNIELDFLYDLHFKLISYGEIDYKSPQVKQFITQYREAYNTEPTKYSFQGFEQMFYFGKLLATNANILNVLVNNNEQNGIIDNYSFIKKDAGAYINTAVHIVEYDKNTFTRITTPYSPK